MLRKLGVILAVTILVGVAIAFYLWRQVTALPDWYRPEEAPHVAAPHESTLEPRPEPPPRGVPNDVASMAPPDADAGWTEPVASPSETTPPVASERPSKKPSRRHERREFHRQASSSAPGGVVKASRAVFEDGSLEAGVVLDLGQIPKDQLGERDRNLYERALQNFPALTRRDVYVGIEDRPITRDGVLALGPSPKIRVGNLRYSLDSAATKLGMSEAQLRREFDRALADMGFVDPNP